MFVPIALVACGGVESRRVRDWVVVAILGVPLVRLSYFALGDASGWRYMLLGFILLGIGALYSVRTHARLMNSEEFGELK